MTTRLIIAVANKKPGTSKTTTAVFLCMAFHQLGLSPVLVDADKGRSATRWAEDAGDGGPGLPFPVLGMATKEIYRQGSAMFKHGTYDVGVIDCPQLEDHQDITVPALKLATDYLIPCAPSWIEFDRTAEVFEILDHVDQLRPSPGRRHVLLTRANQVTRTKKGRDAQIAEVLAGQGYSVLPENVPTHNYYRDAGGEVPRLDRTPFPGIARHLLASAGMEAAA